MIEKLGPCSREAMRSSEGEGIFCEFWVQV